MGQRTSHIVQHVVDRILAEKFAKASSEAASSDVDSEISLEAHDHTAPSSAITVTLDGLQVSSSAPSIEGRADRSA